jgi:hypothetical protein
MKGLIIKDPWIDYILLGQKTWEIRGSVTNIRGTIVLIKSGSGCMFGTADLVDCFEISLEKYQNSYQKHMVSRESINSLPYCRTYAWILTNPVLFTKPISYRHPKGAVIWVNLNF